VVGQNTLLRFLLLSDAFCGLLIPGPPSREPALTGASVSSNWTLPGQEQPPGVTGAGKARSGGERAGDEIALESEMLQALVPTPGSEPAQRSVPAWWCHEVQVSSSGRVCQQLSPCW